MSNYYLKDESYTVSIFRDDIVVFRINKTYKMWGKTYCDILSNTELVLKVLKLESLFRTSYDVLFSAYPNLTIKQMGSKKILIYQNKVYSIVLNNSVFKIWYDLFLNDCKVGEVAINRKNWTFGGKWQLNMLDDSLNPIFFFFLIGITSSSGV